MANPVIKVKRSSVAGKVPAPTQLERGELAVNSYDGKVYIVRDQFSTGIGTTTHTLNPWDEYTIGSKIAYAGIASAQQFDGNITGSVNSSGVSTFASGALDFYRSGGDSYIDNDSGHLIIRNQAGGVDDGHDIYIMAKPGETGILVADDSAVYLYFDNSAKIRTDSNGVLVYGNVALSGTVDGRDVATDGTKLDTIESNATADQTAAEILSLLSDQDITTSKGISVSGVSTSALHHSTKGTFIGTQDTKYDVGLVMDEDSKIYIDYNGYLRNIIGHESTDKSITIGQTNTGLIDDIILKPGSNGHVILHDGTTSSSNTKLATTSTGVNITGDLGVSGNFTGDSTFTGDITGTGDLYLTDTGTDSSAGPIIDLYRNSSSAADADYMGQIKFQGENDADQKIVYAKITGKIQDASDGTEDGIIEFANKKAGSNVITARLRSDSLQLLNGTGLTVAGDSTFTGKVFANHGVQGNINSTGISTISGFTFPSTDGTEDQALVTDGSGSLSFKTLSGGSASSGAGTTISTGVTTATQGQTSFTAPNVFDDGEQATAFSTQVFLNGIKQRLGASNDYQLSAPQTVNFTSGVNVGDDVTIVVYFGHTLEEEFFTATQGQKDFTLSGNLAAAKNYKVFLNGVRLRNTVDYSASAAVVLTQAARAGEQVDIVSDQAEDRLTAVENQTSFAPSDSGTTSDNMQVYMNGVLLRQTEDWSIGSPSVTILDADGLTAGDHLDVVVRRS